VIRPGDVSLIGVPKWLSPADEEWSLRHYQARCYGRKRVRRISACRRTGRGERESARWTQRYRQGGTRRPPTIASTSVVPRGDICAILEAQLTEIPEWLGGISDEYSRLHYAPATGVSVNSSVM
jgi:hypothetical protein